MAVYFGDFRLEEEFNDDAARASVFSGKAAGSLGSSSDVDWFKVPLPKTANIAYTFKGSVGNPGIWNVSWFTSELKLIYEQNITTSRTQTSVSTTVPFNGSDDAYYIRIKAYSPDTFRSDVYFLSVDSPNATPTISVSQREITVVEGDFENPLVPLNILVSPVSLIGSLVVHYIVRSGTANVGGTFGSDIFGSTEGNIPFSPGESSKPINALRIFSDTSIEQDEYFWIDVDRVVVGAANFEGGASSISIKVNVVNDDLDRIAPLATSLSPADESVAVSPSTDIRVTFSESIQRGSGNIVVKTSSGAVVSSFAANSSSEISILGNVLTINPIKDLEYDTSYYVEFPSGSVRDLAGNNYAGTSAYNFATAANPANQTFSGTNLNDTFKGGTGDDYIDGSGGIDNALYDGRRANYIVTKSGNDFKVIDTVGTDGTDTVVRIERLKFADFNVALDWYGNAGTAAKVLGAVFGKEYLANKTYVGIGLDLLDKGMDYADIVSMAVSTDVFAQLAGSRSNSDFVKLVYKNVMGVNPPAADLGYFVGLLDNGTYTQASLALMACETDANKVHVDLVGLANTGIEYLPQPGV